MTNKLFIMLVAVISVVLCSTMSFGETPEEEWLLQRYQANDLDSLRQVHQDISEDTSFGQFLRGLFETDGDEARFYYDRVILFHSGSQVEPYAMERLWQYHYAKGDMEQAERYYGFLQQRHPDFVGLSTIPDFSHGAGLGELLRTRLSIDNETAEIVSEPPIEETAPEELTEGWTVQVGAFSFRSGAQNQSSQMEQFGTVAIRSKLSNGRMLSLVHVGMFKNKTEAEQLKERINRATGIQGRVVAVN